MIGAPRIARGVFVYREQTDDQAQEAERNASRRRRLSVSFGTRPESRSFLSGFIDAWSGVGDTPSSENLSALLAKHYGRSRVHRSSQSVIINNESFDTELLEAFFDTPPVVRERNPSGDKGTQQSPQRASNGAPQPVATPSSPGSPERYKKCTGTAVYLAQASLQYLLEHAEITLPLGGRSRHTSQRPRRMSGSSGGSGASSEGAGGVDDDDWTAVFDSLGMDRTGASFAAHSTGCTVT